MKIKVLGLCRGDGKLYLKIKTNEPLNWKKLSVRLRGDAGTFSANCYPADFSANSSTNISSSFWVLELPVLDSSSVEVELLVDGQVFDSFPLSYFAAKWMSRFNYRVKKELCTSIRNYEEQFTYQQYQLKILNYFEGDEGVIWRVVASWQGNSDSSRPVIKAFDGRGHPIPFNQHLFEFQPANSKENNNKLFLSVELPANQEFFYLIAAQSEEQCIAFASGECDTVPSIEGFIKPGFCSVHKEAFEGYKYGSWLYMKDARADDRAYRKWFNHHRVQKAELTKQKKAEFDNSPLISIVVPCYKSEKLFLLQMIDSVMKQTYTNWELLLLDASPEYGVVKKASSVFRDKRVRYFNLGKNKGIVGNTNEGIKAAKGDFIAFLDHDDLLEPDALYCYVLELNKNPEIKVFFCDEDLFEKPGIFMQPVFKTQLNLDLLYSHNCVTHFLMLERDYLFRIGLSEEEVSGAQDYDLTLRAYEGGGEFCHIPRVLYHWRMHSGSTSGDSVGGKPYAEEAGRIALQRHFDRRNIAVNVETTDHLFVYRVKYTLPDPSPLVSIIIPSKDHIDVLDACIASIINKTTYTNYEIVVVENNSKDAQTFKYYERLQFKHGQVRVITWPDEFNYSKIINFGVQHAKGEYLLFLNNDTEVISSNFIEEMMGYLQRSEVGVIGVKLYFRDMLTQHAGMLVGVHGAVAHVNQNFSRTREGYLARAVRPGNFSGVTGACQMVRRETFDKVGGYTESLAVGFNDIDFCLKLIRAGYRVVFTPYAELFHYEFVSRGREIADSEKIKRWERERQEFATRWKEVFEKGDPFTNPNLDKNSSYYALSED